MPSTFEPTPGPSKTTEQVGKKRKLGQLETKTTKNLKLSQLQRHVLLTQQKLLEAKLKKLEKQNSILELQERILQRIDKKQSEGEGGEDIPVYCNL